jgi:23S rRNA pseudouridine2605 synthase
MPAPVAAERLQKVLSQLGLGSRREAEGWIRAGRLTVNGRPAVLGMRVGAEDQLKLDGRTIRRGPRGSRIIGIHLPSLPGEPLLPARALAGETGGSGSANTGVHVNASISLAERLPRRAGRRFISISPMPTVDGGLELLTSDGATAERLQRAVHGLEMEFSLRVRGELSPIQQQGIREGALDSGVALRVLELEANGGEGSNRWYRLVALGASGNEIRQLVERQAVTLGRMLRTRLGKLELPRNLARSHFRELTDEELAALKP